MRPTFAVLPIAGSGTRLGELSRVIPKALIPINGHTLLELAIREIAGCNIANVILVVNEKRALIEEFIDKTCGSLQTPAGARLNFSYVDQKNPCGLGDAVHRAKDIIGANRFAVSLCDELFVGAESPLSRLCSLAETASQNLITLSYIRDGTQGQYGCVKTSAEGFNIPVEISEIREKPIGETWRASLCMSGRYVLNEAIFDMLTDCEPGYNSEIQLSSALSMAIESDDLRGVITNSSRFDCGSWEGIRSAYQYCELHSSGHLLFRQTALSE